MSDQAVSSLRGLPSDVQNNLQEFNANFLGLKSILSKVKSAFTNESMLATDIDHINNTSVKALKTLKNVSVGTESLLYETIVAQALQKDVARQSVEAKELIIHHDRSHKNVKAIPLSTYRKYKQVETKMESVAEMIQKAEQLMTQSQQLKNSQNISTPVRSTLNKEIESNSKQNCSFKSPIVSAGDRSFSSVQNHIAFTPQPAAVTPKTSSISASKYNATPSSISKYNDDSQLTQEERIDSLLSRIDEDYLLVQDKIAILQAEIADLEGSSKTVSTSGENISHLSENKKVTGVSTGDKKPISDSPRGKYSLADDESVETGDDNTEEEDGKLTSTHRNINNTHNQHAEEDEEDDGFVFIGSSPNRRRDTTTSLRSNSGNAADLSIEYEGRHDFDRDLNGDGDTAQQQHSPSQQLTPTVLSPNTTAAAKFDSIFSDKKSIVIQKSRGISSNAINKRYWSRLSAKVKTDRRPNFSFNLFDAVTSTATERTEPETDDSDATAIQTVIAGGVTMSTPNAKKTAPIAVGQNIDTAESPSQQLEVVKVPSSWRKQLRLHYNYHDDDESDESRALTQIQHAVSTTVHLGSEQSLGDWRHVQPCVVQNTTKLQPATVLPAEEDVNYVSPLLASMAVIEAYTKPAPVAVTTVAATKKSSITSSTNNTIPFGATAGAGGAAATSQMNPFGTASLASFGLGSTANLLTAKSSKTTSSTISTAAIKQEVVSLPGKPRSDSVHSARSVRDEEVDGRSTQDRDQDHVYSASTKSNSRGNSRSNSVFDTTLAPSSTTATAAGTSKALTAPAAANAMIDSIFSQAAGFGSDNISASSGVISDGMFDITKKGTPPKTAVTSGTSSGTPIDESTMTVAQITAAITAIYQQHNPGKVDEIPKLLAKYKDRELELLHKIRAKYNIPAPTTTVPSGGSVGGTVTPSSANVFKLDVLRSPDSTSSPRMANARSSSVFDFSAVKPGAAKTLAPTTTPSLFGTAGQASALQTPFAGMKSSIGGTSTPILGTSPFGTSPGTASSLFGGNTAGTQSPFTNKPTGSLFGTGSGATAGTQSPFGQQAKPQQSPFAGIGQQSQTATALSNMPPLTALSSIQDIAARVTAIYQQYNPSKLNEIPALMEKYRGRELQLIANLEKKYGHTASGTAIGGSPAGAGTSTLFGQSQGVIGGTVSPSTGLGSLFGVRPAVGGTASPFGQQPQQPQSSLFGQPQSQQATLGSANFRTNVIGGTTSPFGNTQQQPGSLFGTSAGTAGTSSPFTQQKATPFGQPSTNVGSSGVGGTASPFGQQQNAGGQFRGNTTNTPSPFGQQPQPSLLGTHVGGTVSPFRSSVGIATPGATSGSSLFGTSSSTTPGTSLFGSAQQQAAGTTPFGQSSPFGQQQPPQQSSFGGPAQSPFGQPQQQTQQSPFGQQQSGFGQTSMFGQQAQQSAGMMGGGAGDVAARVTAIYQQYNPSKLNEIPALMEKYRGRELQLIANLEKKYGHTASGTATGGSPATGAFGGTSTGLFGQAQPQQSPFGQQQQQNVGAFGGQANVGGMSLFNRSPTVPTAGGGSSLFGQQQPQQQQQAMQGNAFGGFGQQQQQPQATPFGQPQQQQQQGLFGGQQQQMGGGGGGHHVTVGGTNLNNTWGR